MRLYFFNLKQSLRFFLLSYLFIFIFIFSIFNKAELYVNDSASLELINQLPESIKLLYSIGNFDLTTYIGFYSIGFPYLVLIFTILFFNKTHQLLCNTKFDEYYLSKPIKNERRLLINFLSALTLITLLSFLIYVSTFIFTSTINDDNLSAFIFKFHLTLFFVTLITTCTYSFIYLFKRSTMYFSILVFTFYITASLNDTNDLFHLFNYINPFSLFSVTKIIDGSLNYMVLIIITLISLIINYLVIIKLANKEK